MEQLADLKECNGRGKKILNTLLLQDAQICHTARTAWLEQNRTMWCRAGVKASGCLSRVMHRGLCQIQPPPPPFRYAKSFPDARFRRDVTQEHETINREFHHQVRFLWSLDC